jgi:putative ATPase
MKDIGYGRSYQYDHDVDGGVALDQAGFPDEIGEQVYYRPVERGMEIKLKEKLDALRAARAEALAEARGDDRSGSDPQRPEGKTR